MVDMAYAFVFTRVPLVQPNGVVLALHGEPVKRDSRVRLQKLQNAARVTITAADRDTVYDHIERQAARAGEHGLFIAAFAGHGVVADGVAHVLMNDEDTSVSIAKVSDFASAARRSLIFVDACRSRARFRGRAAAARPVMPRALVHAMTPLSGQAIFFAAPGGEEAYEDPRLGNGVFTKFVLDGLACKAEKELGFVTVETLAVRQQPSPRTTHDTFVRSMPLAVCDLPPSPATIPRDAISVTAFDLDGNTLWKRDVGATVVDARIVDLDDDRTSEVIIALQGGRILAFDALGGRMWSTDVPVRELFIGYLFSTKRHRQIVALAASRLSIIDHDGTLLAAYSHDGRLEHLAIDRLTAGPSFPSSNPSTS